MGLGLHLRGRWKSGELEAVQTWLDEYCLPMLVGESAIYTDDGDVQGRLMATLHPAAEPIELIAMPDGDGLIASITTSTVGPGYHEYICDLLTALGKEFDVEWLPSDDDGGDETGFFEKRDRVELERQFDLWLGALGRHGSPDRESEQPDYLLMPLDAPRQRVPKAAVITPLGPRDREWVRAFAVDPRVGRDMLAWWASEDAAMHFGRALTRLWDEIRWEPPLDDEDSFLLDEVLTDLEAAYALDPSLDYPWREWDLLNGFATAMYGTGHDVDPALAKVVAQHARATIGPLIGYRRYPAMARPSQSWSIEVPGAFKITRDEDGTWLAHDGARTMRLSAFVAKDPTSVPTFEPTADMIILDVPPIVGQLDVYRHDSGDYIGSGEVAVPGKLATVTLTWELPSERAWAEATFASIRYTGKASSTG